MNKRKMPARSGNGLIAAQLVKPHAATIGPSRPELSQMDGLRPLSTTKPPETAYGDR
jgi:hypothetical protein